MIRAAKTCFVTLLAFVAGCESRAQSGPGNPPPNDAGAGDFPAGIYTRCAQGQHNPTGGQFLNVFGFENGARLTVAQNGTKVALTYVDENGLTWSLNLDATTHTLATITQKGQTIPGFKSLCVLGPGKQSAYPAKMTVTAGAVTYDKGAAFLTLTGDQQSSAGKCGTLSQSQERFWLVCEDRQGGAVPSENTSPARVAQLAAGQYSCGTEAAAFHEANGQKQYVIGGAAGKLTLAKDGAKVTADYRGDASLSGTLRFTGTSSMTARAEAGQTLMAPCMTIGATSQTPEVVRIAAGSLSIINFTLFLSFTGTWGDSSPCPGTQLAGSVICSK